MDAELQQLKDIHLPPAINTWPLAPGWITLFALLLIALVYLIYVVYRRHKKKYTVKYALARLAQIKLLMADNPEGVNIAAEISTLIRRTALYYYRREEIAGLSGNDWLSFLNRSGHTTQFTEETGRLLIYAPYQKSITADLMPLLTLTASWLNTISKSNGLHGEK